MKKAKKILAVFLVVLTISTCIPVSASALSNNMDDILFDADYYSSTYPDLAAAGLRSESALRNHWKTHGCREGRRPSIFYDPIFYLSQYSDIKQAFGNNYEAVFNHFKTCGFRENRVGSREFSVAVYRANYADLRQAFGEDNLKYFKHFREYGAAEQRNATTLLSPTGVVTNPVSGNPSPATSAGTPAYINTSSLRLNIRQAPSTSAPVITKLERNTSVTLLETSNGWCKIRLSNGQIGYASAQYVSAVPASTSQTASQLHSPVPTGCMFSRKTKDGSSGFTGYHDINRGVTAGKTPVYAVADGTVTFRQATTDGYLTSYGNYIRFTSADGIYTAVYAHLDSFNDVNLVIPSSQTQQKSGSKLTYNLETRSVKKGDVLGYIGSTGNSSGPHLHFELYKSGIRIDPTDYIKGLI